MGTASLATGALSNAVRPPEIADDVAELYRSSAEAVYLTALRVTGNAADAEDVLQSVFVRILNHGLRLDPLRSPEHYMRRAATNAAIDLLRRKATLRESALLDS